MSLLEKLEILERGVNVVCTIVNSSTEKEEIRAAGVKLSDPNIFVLLILERTALSIRCDDAIFGGLLLNEVSDIFQASSGD
jgi:hypothetical protein